MSRRRGLGSGLDALIPSGPPADTQAVRRVSPDSIRENRSQPRTRFDEQALDELAASIRAHGLIQPLIVSEDPTGGYELIAGERRLRAARRAGLSEVPVLVKSATPQQLLELALVENVQRADLNPLEEGLAYQTLKDEFGLSDELIAQRVGKSRVAVVNSRRLIKLAPAARQALLDGVITAGHGRALLRFEEPAEQIAIMELVVRQHMSVREAERLAEVAQHGQLAPATRRSLLEDTISVAHAQAMLRIEDTAQQEQILQTILDQGLGARSAERLVALVAEGAPISSALAQSRERAPTLGGAGAAAGATAREAQGAARAERKISPEDAEIQRLFEEALETPVRIIRGGGKIVLSIELFGDDQLQALYDRLGG